MSISKTENWPSSLPELLQQMDRDGIVETKRYQMVRTYMDFRARERGVPIQGTFELTPLCNLDCKMCYVHLSKAQMQGVQLLGVDAWKHIIDDAIDAGMLYARITGGECLTYPGFREIYTYLGDHGIEIILLSNGILMDEEMIDFLKDRPPVAIQITLYGASEEAYERVTGHRQFSRVVENIRRMKAAGLTVDIAVTPNRFTTDGDELITLCHELGWLPSINAGLIAPRQETGRSLEEASLDVYVSMIKQSIALFGGLENETEAEHQREPSMHKSRPDKGVPCGAGRSSFHISWDGKMQPCSAFPGIEADALNMSFHDAWLEIHRQVEEFPLPQECNSCIYEKECKLCVAEHASGAPIGHASPQVCAWAERMAAEHLL